MQKQNNSAQSYPCWPSSRASNPPPLHLVPASTKVHSQASGFARSQVHDSSGCEHSFNSSMGGTAEVKKWNRDSSSQRQRKLNSTRHKHWQFLSDELFTKSTGRIAVKLLTGNSSYSALFIPTNLAAALPEAVDYTLCTIVLPTIRFPRSTRCMLRSAAWSPFAINLADNLAMTAPNGEAVQ